MTSAERQFFWTRPFSNHPTQRYSPEWRSEGILVGRHNTEIQALVARLNNLHEIIRLQAEILSHGEKVLEPLGALLDAIRPPSGALGIDIMGQVLKSFLSCDLLKYGFSERGGFHIGKDTDCMCQHFAISHIPAQRPSQSGHSGVSATWRQQSCYRRSERSSACPAQAVR